MRSNRGVVEVSREDILAVNEKVERKKMISVFSGIRKRGGIAGTRQLSVDSMGISWNELRQKRHNLLESLKDDVDVMLNDLCVKRNVR